MVSALNCTANNGEVVKSDHVNQAGSSESSPKGCVSRAARGGLAGCSHLTSPGKIHILAGARVPGTNASWRSRGYSLRSSPAPRSRPSFRAHSPPRCPPLRFCVAWTRGKSAPVCITHSRPLVVYVHIAPAMLEATSEPRPTPVCGLNTRYRVGDSDMNQIHRSLYTSTYWPVL